MNRAQPIVLQRGRGREREQRRDGDTFPVHLPVGNDDDRIPRANGVLGLGALVMGLYGLHRIGLG